MIHRRIQAALRKVLPRPISERIRSVATGVLTPLSFSIRTGHFRSSLQARAVDREGNPIPWYTYSMIDFLKDKDFSQRIVLEFGSGQSTRWWARRAARVVSLESSREWFEHVRQSLPTNVTLYFTANDLSGFDELVEDDRYDVLIVDGLDRAKAAAKAMHHVKPDGCIILDNSEGHWGPEGSYPILDLFRENGYRRIDFFGYAPGVFLPHCSSLFFKNECFLLLGTENPFRAHG